MSNKILYTVNFKVDNYGYNDSGMCGFENTKTAGFFEPGWNINLLFHDIFEHWFEKSIYFNTTNLSQAGECVALGIREYFYRKTCLVQKFAAYNQYNGCEWNTWNTILGQMSETLEYGSPYPNDFNYNHLKEWDGKNLFKGTAEYYNKDYKLSKNLLKKAEKAFSYGYWLGEYMFSDMLTIIDAFCTNLNTFLDELGFNSLDTFGSSDYPINGSYLIVKVSKTNIVATFKNCVISANQSDKTIQKVIKQFTNQFESEYYY